MGEAADIEVRPPVPVRTEPHPTRKISIGRQGEAPSEPRSRLSRYFQQKSGGTGFMAEAADIEVSPPVAVRTEPHPKKSRLAGRAKLRLTRDQGCPGIFSKNLASRDSWAKPRTSRLGRGSGSDGASPYQKNLDWLVGLKAAGNAFLLLLVHSQGFASNLSSTGSTKGLSNE
jgi:hypothetical protein